jgi:hypothetical protein
MTTIKTASTPWPGRPGRLFYNYYNKSEVSGRNSKGQLILKDNAHGFFEAFVTSQGGTDQYTSCPGAESVPAYAFVDADINALYGKLMGKLNRGNASLGVTLASMNQSMDMIVNRFGDLNHVLKQAMGKHTFVKNTRRRKGAHRTMLANDVLEVEFGWRPFFEDIFNALGTITQTKPDLIRVNARHRINPARTIVQKGEPTYTTVLSGSARMSAVATYAVTNNNLWLANQLGLLNPAQVLWDKIPWSFAVNQVLNVNQFLGAMTDTAGLDIVTGSMTLSSRMLREVVEQWREPPWAGWAYYANTTGKTRDRGGLSNLRPSLQFRMPGFDLEKGLIAGALAGQRMEHVGTRRGLKGF